MIKQKQRIDAHGAYVAPECYALEFYSQGVICQSGDVDDVDITNWQDGSDFPIDF